MSSDLIAISPPRDARAGTTTSLDRLRARFARNEGLPFADVLTEPRIHDALNEHGVRYRNRVLTPVTTLWGFLSQALSEDQSCRDAVMRLIAHRAATGLEICSPNTASYCNARGRLPTAVLGALAKRTARELQAGTAPGWKWNGRGVLIADGSHVSMPDTPANQAAYPQLPAQQPGLGFPLARILVLPSLATGACHDLAIAPYEGKGTGETSLPRELYGALKPGDVVLADSLFDDYFLICELRARGVDIVAGAQYERVGSEVLRARPDGEVLVWRRPNEPRGMTGAQYRRYPKTLTMRQVSVDARDRDDRAERFRVITTILDAPIDGAQIGDLYERRWEGEMSHPDYPSSDGLYRRDRAASAATSASSPRRRATRPGLYATDSHRATTPHAIPSNEIGPPRGTPGDPRCAPCRGARTAASPSASSSPRRGRAGRRSRRARPGRPRRAATTRRATAGAAAGRSRPGPT